MPEADRYSPLQAANALGLSKKAVEQAIQRDAFPNAERVPNPNKPGRTLRVWIPVNDLKAYAASRGIELGELPTGQPPAPSSDSKRRPSPSRARENRKSPEGQQTIWQGLAEELSRENLTLKARVRELEAELEARR